VDYDDCVAALIGDIVDQGVRVVILDAGAVPVFFGPGVDEDEAGVAVAVDVGGSAVIGKVPKEGSVVFVCSLLECCVGRTNSCWS
jgi:hypothetical protein